MTVVGRGHYSITTVFRLYMCNAELDTEEVHLVLSKCALVQPCIKAFGPKDVEYRAQVLYVLFFSVREYAQVVQVHDDEWKPAKQQAHQRDKMLGMPLKPIGATHQWYVSVAVRKAVYCLLVGLTGIYSGTLALGR